MVNSYIDMYEKEGLLEKEHISTKTVRYHITKKGIERRKFLNIGYLDNAQTIYDSAKENIDAFLYNLSKKVIKIFYFMAQEKWLKYYFIQLLLKTHQLM